MKREKNSEIDNFYKELRDLEATETPSFEQTWAGAEKKKRMNKFQFYYKLAAVFMIAAAGLSWILFQSNGVENRAVEADLFTVEWSVPTDDLLVYADELYTYDFYMETDELLNFNENNEEQNEISNF